MFLIFLQNSMLIVATSFILVLHKADYTLFMSIVGVLIASVRIMFTNGSASTKVTYFLFQSLIFSGINFTKTARKNGLMNQKETCAHCVDN